MTLVLVTGSTEEPIDTANAKAHLRVGATDDDSYIDDLIVAARIDAEQFTRRAFVTQIWDLKLDRFPDSSAWPIAVPNPPLQSVTDIKFTDTNNVLQTWDASKYQVDSDSEPGRILPSPGEVWPTTRDVLNAVQIRFIAGYGAADDVPEQIKQGMRSLLAHWYEHREDVIAGTITAVMPKTSDRLFTPYRVSRFS